MASDVSCVKFIIGQFDFCTNRANPTSICINNAAADSDTSREPKFFGSFL
jgi:hypothetical protein